MPLITFIHVAGTISDKNLQVKAVVSNRGMRYRFRIMTADEFFDILDSDSDGVISRADLFDAALKLGWHWPEAPLYAVLDRLAVPGGISGSDFRAYMNIMARDPSGPYGEVLRRASPFSQPLSPEETASRDDAPVEDTRAEDPESRSGEDRFDALVRTLEDIAGGAVARRYEAFIRKKCGLSPLKLNPKESALLIIDPQRSFTAGAWKRSIGANAVFEVKPLRQAFDNIASFLGAGGTRVEIMFTRCPFPPGSYGWDEGVESAISEPQPYFVKPGNSVMRPPTNGFREWVVNLLGRGKTTLVLGGCTLNSCIRVSAVEIARSFGASGLRVVVDAGLCAARTGNFSPSDLFGGASPAETAVDQMLDAGVEVVRSVINEE